MNTCIRDVDIRRKAFTLIELLVVIAIIIIIIALVVPALSGAIERARTVKCLGNLRQWAIALTMYCDDHDGQFPEEGMGGGGLQADKATAWFNVLPEYMGTPGLWEMINDLGQPPHPRKDKTPFHCPSFDMDDLPAPPGRYDAVFSYGYNLWIDHPTSDRKGQGGSDHNLPRLLKLNMIKNPTLLVIFGEVAHTDFDNMAGKHIVYRHGDGELCNLAFADGHAKTYDKAEVYIPQGQSKATNRGVIWDPELPLLEE